jgi:nitroreductase
MHKILEDLHWRYATKRFDPERKIAPADIELVLEALRLTPTSYGLQAMRVVLIESETLRPALREATYGQAVISDASHIVVLCAEKEIRPELIDSYIEQTRIARNADPEKTARYGDFLKRTLVAQPGDQILEWNARQVYISLGMLLSVCAQLRIDALPMEGFQVGRYNEILGLEEANLSAVLVCPIGYRHAEDVHQHYPKVRRSGEELFDIR